MSENNQNNELLNEEQAVQAVTEAAAEEQAAEAPAEPVETQIQPTAPTAVAVEAAPAPKKKGIRPTAIITAILACLVVAGGLFAVKTFLAPKPDVIVKQAFAATVADQEKLTEEIYQAIPAAKKIFEPSQAQPTKSDFDFTLKSIEGIDYAALVSAVIADSGICGSSLIDPNEGVSAVNFTVDLKDKPLIEADMYLSTDLMTVSVPTFSDTVLSVAPKSLAADYKNSIFNQMAPMGDEELQMMQDLIIGEIDYIKTLNNISYEKLTKDITAIFAKALTNATYSYDKNTKLYVVNIPGEDVKAAVCEYYRYLYLDSEISSAMERMLSPILDAAGEDVGDYDSTMNEMIAEIEGTIPALETVINLEIEKNPIKKANIVATPAAAEGEAVTITSPIVCDVIIDGKNCDMSMSFDMSSDDAELDMKMLVKASGKFENDAYTITCDVDVNSADAKVKIPVVISIAANGDYNITAGFDTTALEDNVKLDFTSNGKITFENDVLSLELPASRIDYAISGETANTSGALVFDYSQTNAPLSDKIAAPEGTVAVFSLTESELQNLINEYTAGAQGLAGQLMSALM